MIDVDLGSEARSLGGSPALRAELYIPVTPGPWPGVVMIHEIFGLNEVMRRHAERLALAGYLTLAVDLFGAGGLRCVMATTRTLVSGRGAALVDIDVAREHLRGRDDCTGKVGVIGFCMGGGFALLTADAGFDAASVNYGQLPRNLPDAVAKACPIVGSYGARDATLRRAAGRLATALDGAGVTNDVKEYPGAGHAFLNETESGPRLLRPLLRVAGVGPEPHAAADAWRRIESFFHQHLRQ